MIIQVLSFKAVLHLKQQKSVLIYHFCAGLKRSLPVKSSTIKKILESNSLQVRKGYKSITDCYGKLLG